MRLLVTPSSIFEIFDRAFVVLAGALLLGMLAGAVHDVSRAWDSWYYHLPFAALLGGVPNPASFELSNINRARFSGFPLFGEAMQALLWRLSGTPVAANLFAFSSIPLFAVFLWRRFGVPPHLPILGLLAVPLIQIHATSCYVDLPANLAASGLVLSVIQAFSRSEAPGVSSLGVPLVLAAVASNMKFQLEPIVLAAIGMLAARVAMSLDLAGRGDTRRKQARSLVWIAAACPIVFATPLKNLLIHRNPVFPEQLGLLGWSFPGLEQPYESSPIWLTHAAEPVRFLASVFELHLQPVFSHARWSIDQWSPPSRDDYRMGGFFGVYVAFQLCLLLVQCVRERSSAARAAAIGFGLLTLVTSVLPQAHELRYYLCWVIVLVSLNCWLAVQGPSPKAAPRLFALLSTVFLGIVLYSTRLAYVYPSGVTLHELIAEQTDSKALSAVSEGEKVCVRRLPFALLWAAPFHPGRHYRLKQGETPEDCSGFRVIE